MEWPDCLDPDSQSLPKPPEEWTQQQCEAVHAIVRATKKCNERDIKEAKAKAFAEDLARAKWEAADEWLWLLNLTASGSGSKRDEEGDEGARQPRRRSRSRQPRSTGHEGSRSSAKGHERDEEEGSHQGLKHPPDEGHEGHQVSVA